MKQTGIMVLARSYPTAQQLPEAMSVYEDYCALVKKQAPATSIELICAVEGQLAWIEHWESRTVVQAFYDSYSGMSDLPVRLMNSSKRMPERHHYQALSDRIK